MIMNVELFLQVLAFLDQLAPQEQRRLMEMSQLDSQLTKAERVQSRMVSSLVSLCVHEGLSLLMYSACQECQCSLHKTEGDQQRSLIWTLRHWWRESSQEWWVHRSLCVCMRVYYFQCTVPTKSASSMSSLTTKGRVVNTKVSTGTYFVTYMYMCTWSWMFSCSCRCYSISRPTRSTRAKEARGDVSVRLPSDKGGKSPVKKSANACSTRQKETNGDLSFGLPDSGEESPVKNGEFSQVSVCACMRIYSF